MNINQAFPSTYLKAGDLNGKAVRVAIRKVLTEDIGGDHKPVMYFEKTDKGMVLNKTNANTIAQAYGYETDDWVGGEIELFPTMVDFQGRSVEAIRCKVPPRRPAAQRKQETQETPPTDAPYDNGFEDEIPF